MKLTYFPDWQIENQSKHEFSIQEDQHSISIVSAINDFAMGILSEVTFTVENNQVVATHVENNSKALKVEVDEQHHKLTIVDL